MKPVDNAGPLERAYHCIYSYTPRAVTRHECSELINAGCKVVHCWGNINILGWYSKSPKRGELDELNHLPVI